MSQLAYGSYYLKKKKKIPLLFILTIFFSHVRVSLITTVSMAQPCVPCDHLIQLYLFTTWCVALFLILRSLCKCSVPVYETYRRSAAWIQGHSLCPPGKNWPCAPRPLCVQWWCPAGHSYWRHPCCGSVCLCKTEQNTKEFKLFTCGTAQTDLRDVCLLLYVSSNQSWVELFPIITLVGGKDSLVTAVPVPLISGLDRKEVTGALVLHFLGEPKEDPEVNVPHRGTIGRPWNEHRRHWHEMGWKVLLASKWVRRVGSIRSFLENHPEHFCVGRTSVWITIPH